MKTAGAGDVEAPDTYELVRLLRGSTPLSCLKWRGRERVGDPVDRLVLDDTQLFEFGPDGEFYALMLPEDL